MHSGLALLRPHEVTALAEAEREASPDVASGMQCDGVRKCWFLLEVLALGIVFSLDMYASGL